MNKTEKIKIDTEIIKLDSFLKWAAIASSGSEAKFLIQEEMIKVNNEICTQRGKKLKVGDIVTVWVLSVDTDKNRIGLTMKKPKDWLYGLCFN